MKKSDFLKRLTKGGATTALGLITLVGLSGCSENISKEKTPNKPKKAEKDCSELEWDADLGVWKCDDDNVVNAHGGGGYYYYANGWHQHANVSSLKSSSSYKSYASKPSFRGGSKASTGFKSSSVGKAGGFASGARGGFGG